jgi:hypothetical protein
MSIVVVGGVCGNPIFERWNDDGIVLEVSGKRGQFIVLR